MRCSYHTHTRWSDGSGDMDEYMAAAAGFGLDELGFSDHYAPLAKGITADWSIPYDQPAQYLAAVQEAAGRATGGLTVRAGLEVDYIPDALPLLRQVLDKCKFDYLIGSVHIIGDLAIDGSPSHWAGLSQDGIDSVFRTYWERIKEMVETKLFDVAAHLDVINKSGLRPSADLSSLIGSALDAMRNAQMAVELNTSGWHSLCEHCFPEEWILRECVNRNIPILITADAHEPANLIRDFDRAERLLAHVGSKNTVNSWFKRV